VRVGAAMFASIILTSGLNLPHGLWASVTVLVVIGGLQHQGNIRQKAFERGIGTLIGALAGLLCIAQQSVIGSLALTYVLMSLFAGVCAFYAIGRTGYIALLTGITLCIVAGHGDNPIDVGLWRSANVLFGIVIALAFSFALPLHATYSWRFGVAANLRKCARLYDQLLHEAPLRAEQQLAAFADLSARLVALRAMMPSVAKETGAPLGALEEIQRQHRTILSALEMIAAASLSLSGAGLREQFAASCRDEQRHTREILLSMAQALRSGRVTRLDQAVARAQECAAAPLPVALEGPHWLAQRLAEQVEHMRELLGALDGCWNLEGIGRTRG
jgi:uncharacterized membrane protein YccC